MDRYVKGSQARAEEQTDPKQGNNKRKKRTPPPPAVNEPLAFINFVAAYTVGSTIEGEVVSFTSHGAMVDVPLPVGGALHCYIPLTAMGTPPPTKARQVLKKGEVRSFVLAGLDPPRRVAELAISTSAPEVEKLLPAPTVKKAAPAAKRAPTTKAAPSTTKAAAKKAAPAKKAAKKVAAAVAATKAPKKVAAKKAAKAKKVPAKKVPAKKASVKKAGKPRAR
jgi:ribosomal protein S1